MAADLSIVVDWCRVLPEIARVDWLSAAVIATLREGESDPPCKPNPPKLPSADELLAQRSLRKLGRVTIRVSWGYEQYELEMSYERWIRILTGDPWTKALPYWYEGERFMSSWNFDGRGHLSIIDDEGAGCWEGEVGGVDDVEGPVIEGVDIAMLALHARCQEG